MYKTAIIFGDIHGRNIWKKIVEENPNAEYYIFLGDYFTSRENIDVEDQIRNYEEILEFKKQNLDRVILLRGNHDLEALKQYHWAECWPKFYSTYFRENDNAETFLKYTQWCFEINNVVFSHAGISDTWFCNVQKAHPEVQMFEDLNELEPTELFGFTPESYSDSSGYSKTQPLVWIRPFTLSDDMIGNTIYVVGHTRQPNDNIYQVSLNNVKQLEDDVEVEFEFKYSGNDAHIICCDTLPQRYLTLKFTDKVSIFKPVKI